MQSIKKIKKFSSLKISLGFFLLNFYSLTSIVFFLLSLDYFLKFLNFNINPIWWLSLGIILLLSAISIFIKLICKSNFIWLLFFDILLIPISIVFYIYVYKTRKVKVEKWIVNIAAFRFWLIYQALCLLFLTAMLLAIGSHCLALSFQNSNSFLTYFLISLFSILFSFSFLFAGYIVIELVINKWSIKNANKKMEHSWLLFFGSPLTWPFLLIFFHKNFYLEFDVYESEIRGK